MILLISISIVLFICLLFVFAPSKANIAYLNNEILVDYYLLNIRIYKYKHSLKKNIKTDKNKSFNEIMEKIKKLHELFNKKSGNIKEILELAKNKIKLNAYSVVVDIGAGNAALTGVLIGSLNGVLGLIFSFIGNILTTKQKPEILVNPFYNKFIFDISGSVVLEFNIFNIIRLYRQADKKGLIPREVTNDKRK
jgi:hypothetical protein